MSKFPIKSRSHIFSLSLSLILILSFCCFPIGADENPKDEGGSINLLVGQIKMVAVDTPSRVSVANPLVADVSSITEKEIVLAGKAAGNTTLMIWDNAGERSFIVRVFSEDLNQLKKELGQLLAKLKIAGITLEVDETQGKVLLTGKIKEEKQGTFDKIIEPYKGKVIDLVIKDEERPLVLIDVEILEITKNDLDDLGINWINAMQFREEPYGATSSGTTTLGVTTSLDKVGGLSEILRISEWSRDALTIKLNFLKTQGKARTLSRPKLVCISGKEANLLVGGQVPIVTVSTSTTGSTTNADFKDYGVSLKIKPTVKDNNDIQTTIETEVSDIDWANAVTASGIRIPATVSRKASTELYIKEGQTIFIAGLLKNKDATNLNKLPGLAEVPVLGALFRSKRFQLDQTELVISLTPTIMRKGKSASQEEEVKKAISQTVSVPTPREIPRDPISQYAYGIQNKINQAAIYPAIAEESRWEGTVHLSLHVLGDGKLEQSLLLRSSDNNFLDEAALALVNSQAPYPAFGPQIQAQDLWIDITIIYRPE